MPWKASGSQEEEGDDAIHEVPRGKEDAGRTETSRRQREAKQQSMEKPSWQRYICPGVSRGKKDSW